MKSRDAIIDDLHKLRERIGRAHGFDVDRIAVTIRQHEREAGLGTAAKTPGRSKEADHVRKTTGCPTPTGADGALNRARRGSVVDVGPTIGGRAIGRR